MEITVDRLFSWGSHSPHLPRFQTVPRSANPSIIMACVELARTVRRVWLPAGRWNSASLTHSLSQCMIVESRAKRLKRKAINPRDVVGYPEHCCPAPSPPSPKERLVDIGQRDMSSAGYLGQCPMSILPPFAIPSPPPLPTPPLPQTPGKTGREINPRMDTPSMLLLPINAAVTLQCGCYSINAVVEIEMLRCLLVVLI